MAKDIVNFNAGPAGLPRPALERAHAELLDYDGTGMSIMEHSHRGKAYDAVHTRVLELVKTLLQVPDTHDVLLTQGGASGMFATVAMNFLPPAGSADYVVTGAWAKKALAEAQIVGTARAAANAERDGSFLGVPQAAAIDWDPKAAYAHITSNNTIAGTQWSAFPEAPSPLVVDMSSDIMSYPMDVSKFGMIYAGAQKNLGPSGVVLAIINKSWAASGSKTIPKILRYQTHLEKGSLFHTPPTFAIYLMRNVLEWIQAEGGLAGMQKRNAEKAALLYGAIDESDGFFRSPIDRESRSKMNVVFRLPSEALEAKFVLDSQSAGLVGLKGHRSVGGLRASIYNAVSPTGVARLVEFMARFKKENS